MRLLFDLDKHDYAQCTHTYVRNSARSIIISEGRVAMVHSRKYDYYKFPGGGIEEGEDPVGAMIRETREEAGLVVRRETVREYGYVHRIQKGHKDETECFIQDNFYYLCQAEEERLPQALDAYEDSEGYELVFIEPAAAIEKDLHVTSGPYAPAMFEREVRVLQMLVAEGLFD